MRTKRQERAYIDRIIKIKNMSDELNIEKRTIAKKLGMGTWRSRNHRGMVVVYKSSAGGWRVSWKDVANGFAKRLGLTDKEVTLATYGHRNRTHASPCVTVKKDTANLNNPKLKVA